MKQLTPQALTVLEKRYLRKDEKGQVIETPDEMFLRVASALGKDADQTLDFYHLMSDLDFLPNSPTLMNAGTGAGSLSACFVIPVEDSMEGITKASHDAAMVQKFGGGCIGGESIILTERGPIRAKDLVEGKMATKVYSYASKAKLTDIGAYHIIDHDTTVEVTFDTGSVMRASDFHPFFVWDGDKVIEKRADELVEGDAVIGSTRWCGSSELDLGGWGIGAIVSDGGFDKGGYRLRVCKNNEKFIQRCAEFLKRNYRHATDKRYSSDVWEVCAQGAEMVEFSKNFTDGVTCETKRLPVRVWSESVDYQASVLVGLLDGDGYYNKKGQFEYATVSDDLALDVLALAGVLGLRARDVVKKPRRQNEQPVHTIIFSRSVFLNETMRTLSVRHNPKHDVVSHGLIRLNNTVIRDSLSSSGVNLSGREVWKVGAEIDGYLIHVAKWLSKGMISRNHAAIMLRKIGDEVNAAAVHSTQIVKKAVKAGADTLYDLTVPGPQNYIAGTNGGFAVVHNTGFSLSRIRPKGSGISTTHGAACGPVAVLKYLSATSTLVTQGGKRDGANMGILRVDHPDIREFIHCKDSSVAGNAGDTLHNFNISVGITDEFMEAVKADEVFDLKFNGLYYDAVDARELWQEIIESAHKTGDPGVVFLDRANNSDSNPIPSLKQIESTNPCGEQFLAPYESCNLGSINLGNFVKGDHTVDWDRLAQTVRICTRLLDRVVSVNVFPIPEVTKANEEMRRIGAGPMGWHDMLLLTRTRYDSEEGIKLASQVSKFINETSLDESIKLGQELGSFPLFEQSIYADKYPALRNSNRTTVAPTGTISLMAGCSSGIEPNFAWEYKHNGLDGKIKETIKNPIYAKAIEEGWYDPDLFKSAMEIDPVWHVRMQAAWQENIDNSVSKTVNLPQSATVEDVKRCYEMAWDLGCKGVTIYRDGSKGSQVLETVKPVIIEPSLVSPEFMGEAYNAQHRPDILTAVSIKQPTPFGTAYLTITEDEGQPLELFATLGKAGSDVAGMLEAMCRVVSKQLRAANPGERRGILSSVRDQWAGIGGATTSGFGPSKVKSLPDALSRALSRYLDSEAPVDPVVAPQEVMGVTGGIHLLDLCPDCQNYTLQHGEGCAKCLDCGYSKC